MNTNKLIYWLSTGILSGFMIISAIGYFLHTEKIEAVFSRLGYPTQLIYPLAIFMVIGALILLLTKNTFIKELTYAGFFFNYMLAISAHIIADYGSMAPALGSIALLIISYIFDKILFKSKINY